MQEEYLVEYKGCAIPYQIVVSARAKHIRISIGIGGRVAVTKPKKVSELEVRDFVHKKREWIHKHVMGMIAQTGDSVDLMATDRAHFMHHRGKALALCEEKVLFWNSFTRFSYNTIRVRYMKHCWGTCSTTKNLSFNYKVLFLPEEMVDDIIVHELCHLQEMNHSKQFWQLVTHVLSQGRQGI